MATLGGIDVDRVPPIGGGRIHFRNRGFDGAGNPIAWNTATGTPVSMVLKIRGVTTTVKNSVDALFASTSPLTNVTLVDDDSVSHTVRFWTDQLEYVHVAGGRWNIDIPLLKVS